MLAVALPGLIAWVFVRFRGGIFLKIAILAAAFLVTEGWMKFVIETRSGANIAMAFQQLGIGGVVEKVDSTDTKHQGLNMFEELAWVNSFIDKGTYVINNGARYFAELVNPIPRAIWPDKPMIGIDYAIARGQLYGGAGDEQAGVGATISTGMIGQGGGEFWRFFWSACCRAAYGLLGGYPCQARPAGGENGPYAFVFHWMCFDFQPGKGYHAHYFISIFVWVFHACILV
jgi:hypothetical protein